MATLKKTKNWFSRPIIANAGQKYCRMLHGEHSAILLTFIKLPFVIKIFILSIFEWQVLLYVHIPIYLSHTLLAGYLINYKSCSLNFLHAE